MGQSEEGVGFLTPRRPAPDAGNIEYLAHGGRRRDYDCGSPCGAQLATTENFLGNRSARLLLVRRELYPQEHRLELSQRPFEQPFHRIVEKGTAAGLEGGKLV